MYQECHCFMYVGVNTSTLKYQDSSCRNGSVYTKESIFKDVDGTNIVMQAMLYVQRHSHRCKF